MKDNEPGIPDKEIFQKTIQKRACPYTQNPTDECYCSEMGSVKTEAAIYYCGEHYEECEIYKKIKG